MASTASRRGPPNPKKRSMEVELGTFDVATTSSEDSASELEHALPHSDREHPRRTRSDGDATVRQRYRGSSTKILDEPVARDNRVSRKRATRPRREEPEDPADVFLPDVASDFWRLIKTMLRVMAVSYPIWKWVLFLYALWLAGSYLLVLLYNAALSSATSTLCPIPFIGSQIPFCAGPRDRPIDASKMATSQDGLVIVMEQVGQGFDLARDIVGHEFAVRDLRLRVTASSLPRKQELTRELESLIRHTKQAAKGLSRFTAKVGKSIDTAKTFDEYAVKSLEGIAERQRNPPTLPGRILSAIGPFAAFDLVGAGETEEQVKQVFITTATRISAKVKMLMDEAFELSHSLDTIQETLDSIKEITTDELGDLPRMDVLGAIWLQLARPDDHAEHKSHTGLLKDMTNFYVECTEVMKVTTGALNRVEAELGEFRDDFAAPGLILKDYPLEVIISLLRRSVERLEAGRSKLEHVEQGGRPEQGRAPPATARTVTATLARASK